MTKSILAVAALVLLMAGCASVRVGPAQTLEIGGTPVTLTGVDGFRPSAVTLPDPQQPNVFIVNGKIVVDQEPVRPTRDIGENKVLVTWALDFSSNYTFPSNTSITFAAGAPTVSCRRGPMNKVIGCLFTKPAVLPAQWKYAITVINDKGVSQTLDPSMSMD